MPIQSVRDGYDASLIVRTAVEALAAFGGSGLGYHEARALLPMWQHNPELTVGERRAVLARFPRACHDIEGGTRLQVVPDIEGPGNSGPGF